jgi:hypothetical protein
VSAPLLGSEHLELARDSGAEIELLRLQRHKDKGAGVPCASQVG